MSAAKQLDQKRFIGYSNDSKKHQNHHMSGNQIAGEQRWQGVADHHKKKQYLLTQQQQQQQLNSSSSSIGNTNSSNTNQAYSGANSHQQIKNQFVGEFIPQQATDTAKKEKRNKDRLSHLSKLLPQKSRWIGYLDVGCGNAEISVTIAQHLGIGSVYGVDMFTEEDFEQPSMDLEVKYIQNDSNEIRIPDNSVDLITCFMAIHHFEHLDLMLREIQRVLLIDGYLFIREHDVPWKNKQLRSYIDEQHRKYPDHPADGYMMLYDREELKDILFAYGFEHLGDSNYTGQNLQAVYHSLYILKRKEVLPNFKQLIHKNRKNKADQDMEDEEEEQEENSLERVDNEEDQENNNSHHQNSSSNRESINSKQDEDQSLDLNQLNQLNSLSLSSKKASSNLQTYNKKEMFEQYQQIVLQNQSDSVLSRSSSSEYEKEKEKEINNKKHTPLKQKNTIEEKKKSQKKTNQNASEKILSQSKGVNGYNQWDDSNMEEEDVYASIISIPPQKKESSTSNSQASKVTIKKPAKTQEKAQLLNAFNQENSPSSSPIIEPKQKNHNLILDDDGFVVVGQKDNKKKLLPQQQSTSSTSTQQQAQQLQKEAVSQNQKKQESVKKAEEIVDEEEDAQTQQQDETNTSEDPSNQFIYIKSKKQQKKKSNKK